MPFTVNPPCPGTSVTEITYQFAGMPLVKRTDGDDYRVITTVIPDKYEHNITVYFTPTTRGCIAHPPWSYQTTAYGPFTGETRYGYQEYTPGCIVVQNVSLSTIASNGDPEWILFGFGQYFGTAADFAVPGSVSVVIGEQTGKVIPGGIRRAIWIYKNGTRLLSTAQTNRELTSDWRCIGICPRFTCEVQCGKSTCCYNSRGVSVANYTKA